MPVTTPGAVEAFTPGTLDVVIEPGPTEEGTDVFGTKSGPAKPGSVSTVGVAVVVGVVGCCTSGVAGVIA